MINARRSQHRIFEAVLPPAMSHIALRTMLLSHLDSAAIVALRLEAQQLRSMSFTRSLTLKEPGWRSGS